MNNILYSIIGIFIPFLGTTIGSSFVIFLRKNLNEKLQKIIVGFAAGVMISASIWSLILPSYELAEEQGLPRIYSTCGRFCFRNYFFDLYKSHCRQNCRKKEWKKIKYAYFFSNPT